MIFLYFISSCCELLFFFTCLMCLRVSAPSSRNPLGYVFPRVVDMLLTADRPGALGDSYNRPFVGVRVGIQRAGGVCDHSNLRAFRNYICAV